MNCNSDNEILTIPWGNDFRLSLCEFNIVPGNIDATFADIQDIKTYIVCFANLRTEVDHEIIGADITLMVPREKQRRTVYGIEITGTYQGHSWRWKATNRFRIANSNCEATMNGMETFGVETYYLKDVLEVDVDGDTMLFTTHGHADLKDETLILQSTDSTDVTVDGDTLIFTIKD